MAAMIIISLLKKPLNGGIPEIDIEAIKDVADVAGIDLANPPISFRSRVPRVYSIAPALRNKSPLKAAWLIKMKKTSGYCKNSNFWQARRVYITIMPIPTDRIT